MADISFKGLNKSYGAVRILRGIDLEIRDGEFIALVGPSGCGKSTLLRLLAGLESATDGDIRIGGRSVSHLPPKDRDIAMVFQSYALYPHMTVRDNLTFSLRMRGYSRDRMDAAVHAASSKLGLDELLNRKPSSLSGGQRQRVAMGRAMVREPQVFLFDEPLSNLDARLREQMRHEIRRLQRDLGITSIYVTHDQIEAMTMADRIVALNAGVIQQVGTPSELYENPSNAFVAGFIGSPAINVLQGTLTPTAAPSPVGSNLVAVSIGAQRVGCVNRTDTVRDTQDVQLGIRPERIRLLTPGDSAAAADAIPAVVDLIEPTGLATIVHLRLAGQSLRVFTTERIAPRAGDRVSLAVASHDLLLFDPPVGNGYDERRRSRGPARME